MVCRLRLLLFFPALALSIRSFGFAGECLGQHSRSDQQADLGDGRGYRTSPPTVSTLGDGPTDYFGMGKLAVTGEERFRSLTELK